MIDLFLTNIYLYTLKKAQYCEVWSCTYVFHIFDDVYVQLPGKTENAYFVRVLFFEVKSLYYLS